MLYLQLIELEKSQGTNLVGFRVEEESRCLD